MFRTIGIIVFLAFLYVGFFGWKEKNISPFLLEIFKQEKVEKLVKETGRTVDAAVDEVIEYVNKKN